MVARAVALGAASFLIVAAFAAVLASALRCIDSAEFYDPRVLIGGALAAGMIVTGSVLLGAGRGRIAMPVVVLGLALASYAIVAPPYKACAQFFVPM